MLLAQSLSKAYGGLVALSEVTFEASPGELIALVGPNGAGKTTLLDVISGYTQPDRGTVQWQSQDWGPESAWARSRKWVARQFQHVKLTSTLTVAENVHLQTRAHKGTSLTSALTRARKWRRQQQELASPIRSALAEHALAEHMDEPASRLSFGQRKALAYSAVSWSRRPIVLLDEPFAGLDAARIDAIAEGMRLAAREGVLILFVEHSHSAVASIAQRAIALSNGALIADGAPRDILRSATFRKAYRR